MAKDGLTIVSGLNSELEFSADGADWTEIPFTSDIEASGGEPPTAEVVTFKRVGQVTGHDRLPSLSVQVPSFVPHHSSWRALIEANRSGDPMNFRITTKERERESSGTGTAAMAVSGAVTLNPLVTANHPVDWRTDRYGVGLGIKIGDTVYLVDSITDTGVLTVDPPPKAVVAAAVYKVVTPGLRLGPFLATASGLSSFSLPVEGALNKTLTINPVTQLPNWVID